MSKFSLENAYYFTNELEPKLVAYAKAAGILIFGAEAQRFKERQIELYESKRSWTLESDHLVCTAKDYELLTRNNKGKLKWVQDKNHPHWEELGTVWKSLDPGCYWGGDWETQDVYHFGYNPRKDNK